MRDFRGKKKGIKKAGTTVISATLLTAGAVGVAFAYQSGVSFHPSGKKQDLKKNQVVFSKNKKVTGQNEKKQKDNSRFLKNDNKNKQGANNQENADYMFQNGMMMSKQQPVSIATNSNVQQTNDTSKDSGKNTYYQVTKDPTKADIVVDQPNSTDSNEPSGPSDTVTDSNSNDSNNSTNSDNNSSDDNNHNSNNDHNSNKDQEKDNSNNTSDDKDHKTETRPSDTAKDPQSKKETVTDTLFPTKPFVDTMTPFEEDDENGNNRSVIIQPSESNTNAILYKGQEIKEKDLFNCLDTFVYGKDNTSYVWGETAYDHYIKILGVSFDGGDTWVNEYPTTIPTDLAEDGMKIKVGYRLSEKKDWSVRIVDYVPKEGRVFLLSQKITQENSTITDDIIVNKYNQHPEIESMMNLLRQQEALLGEGRQTALFPGWMEKGKLQPWFYEVTAGRHILEPADMVPLDDKYIVKLKFFWMNNDGTIDQYGDNLIYLQTLTDMNEALAINWTDQDWTGSNLYNTLSVPKYTQAIAIDSNADLSVNYLEIPDTVLYIQLDNSGMRVNERYKVDENNETYASNKAGILLTKDHKKIIGIPYNTKKLEIEESIDEVSINEMNQLSEIDLSDKSLDEIPQLEYSRLTNCKIVVPDDLLIPYIQQNYKSIFANKGNTVAASSDPDQEYRVEKEMIINKQGRMILMLASDRDQLNLNNSINMIAADAFKNAKDLKTIVMPENGSIVSFEENSLRGSNVKTIQCYSKEQYDSIVKQLKDIGASEDLTVQMIATSKEGYKYYMQLTEDSKDVVLMSVPKNITQFEGVITAEDGSKLEITEIGNEAFSECKNLQWVTLPESVKTIKAEAFVNCTALEGILIDSKDKITIGDKSFDGCTSLRFVASNAKEGIMENDYQPEISDSHGTSNSKNQYLYVPGDCIGYNKSCISLISGSDQPLTAYRLKDLGDGSKMLYGVDDKENPWLAIRSGKVLPDDVKLPEQTKEIFSFAMADTISDSGKYQINLEHIRAISKGAFYNSQISGDITLKENVSIFEEAMKNCTEITSVTIPGDNIYLSNDIFNGCSNLKEITIGKIASNAAIQMGLFNGCDNLSDIYLSSEEAERLMLVDFTIPYRFNTDWGTNEEAEKLKIHIPDGSEENYIKGWRYIYCGYAPMYDISAYEYMRQDIQYKYMDWTTWEFPTDEEVDAIQKQELLAAENRIRKMIGISTVSDPTDVYLYHTSTDGLGILTFADATTSKEKLDLGDNQELELPEGWYFDYIGTGAFKNAKNLTNLTIPENMAGINDKAFEDMQSDTLNLYLEGSTPLELVRNDDGDAFDFGKDDNNLHIHVPEGSQNDYLRAWLFPMAGYEDDFEMLGEIIAELSEDGEFPDAEILYQTMAKRLLPVENRLRKMMGMEQIDSIYDMCYKDKWGLSKPDEDNTRSMDETKPEETDQETNTEETNQQETVESEEQDQKTTTQPEQDSSESPEDTKEETTTATDQKEETTTAPDKQKQISIPKTTTKMESDLYDKDESDHIELIFEGETPLKLQIKEKGKEFSFGKDDDKITISVPKGYEEAYIEQWKYAMAGYEDLESMKKAIKEDLKEKQPTDEEIDEAVSQKLLQAENRLRKMMNMEEKEK